MSPLVVYSTDARGRALGTLAMESAMGGDGDARLATVACVAGVTEAMDL